MAKELTSQEFQSEVLEATELVLVDFLQLGVVLVR